MQPDPRYLPVCDRMPPISLEEMDAIRLMNRVDTKYVTNGDKLVAVLEDAAAAGYRICEIEGKRISGYNSLYYDTDGLQMYLAHHNGRKTRQKARSAQSRYMRLPVLLRDCKRNCVLPCPV